MPPYLSEYPLGLERTVLHIISLHIGRDHAIGGQALTTTAGLLGFPCQDRQVREAIKQLRRDGHLIGSAAGDNGGYFLIASHQEFEDFASSTFRAQIVDMSETLKAMQSAAAQKWGTSLQQSLF
jgi:hypothetical protein